MDNKLVRYSRAGDAFHYRWAARRCLRMIDPKSSLKCVTIESSKESKAAGECVLDLAEYSENETDGKTIAYFQLKHTTVRTGKNFTWTEIKHTLAGFAERYHACFIKTPGKFRERAVTFSFISNRLGSKRLNLRRGFIQPGSRPPSPTAAVSLSPENFEVLHVTPGNFSPSPASHYQQCPLSRQKTGVSGQTLFAAVLDPADRITDQGVDVFQIKLPADAVAVRIDLPGRQASLTGNFFRAFALAK